MELRKALTISLILLVAAGCHQKPKKLPTSAPAMTTEWKSSPVGVTASAVMVRQGRSPLVYIVPEPAKVRVVDLSSGKNVAAGPVGAQTLVRIDDEHGVIFGDQTMRSGPLMASHVYQIFLDPSGENVSREGRFAPKSN